MESDPLSDARPAVPVTSASGGPGAGPEVPHDHAWRSLTVGPALTYSEYECSLCGITWSL